MSHQHPTFRFKGKLASSVCVLFGAPISVSRASHTSRKAAGSSLSAPSPSSSPKSNPSQQVPMCPTPTRCEIWNDALLAPYCPRNSSNCPTHQMLAPHLSTSNGFRTSHPHKITSCFGKYHVPPLLHLAFVHICPSLCLLLRGVWMSPFKAQSKSSSLRKMC